MKKIAHITNPVCVDESSILFTAQPITFESMRKAKEFARGKIDVMLFSAQYPEDHSIVPKDFQLTTDLDRSILDINEFKTKRKLPLIKDILDRLYESADADYMIYTNVDIALMPHFYLGVNALINEGHDAFVVNRRTISNKYQSVDQLHLMFSQVGDKHPGHDCFVFKRSLYPKFKLGNACIGTNWIGKVLTANFIYHASSFKEFKNLHLTFHIGDDRRWNNSKFADYHHHNDQVLSDILEIFKNKQSFIEHPIISKQIQRHQKKHSTINSLSLNTPKKRRWSFRKLRKRITGRR